MKTGLQWMLPFANRDRMVERFVEGRMEGMELRAFQKMLGTDPKLQRMVETERAIRGTLLRDRNHIPADDPRGRAHLLAMLATLPSEPVGIAAGTAAQSGASQGASSVVGTVMKGLAIAATGAVLTVGLIFGVRALDDNQPAGSTTPAPVQVESHAAPTEATETPRIEQTAPAAALPVQTHSAPVEASTSRAAVRSVQQRTTATTNTSEHRTRTTVTETTSQSDEVSVPQTQTHAEPRRKPVVVLPDTMRVNVMIEMDGEK
jgi:hypothetical protein